MSKKCGRSLQDITPLLANGNKPAANRPNLKLPLSKNNDYPHIIDQTAKLLKNVIREFRELSRENILESSVPVELIGVNFKGEPLLVKCSSHCSPLFFTECLEALGIVKDNADSGVLDYPELNKKYLASPRLIVVATTFAPGIFKILNAVSSLGIEVYRIAENEDMIEMFDYNRHDFYPAQMVNQKRMENQSVKQNNSAKVSGNNQLSLNLENELDEIRPLNASHH